MVQTLNAEPDALERPSLLEVEANRRVVDSMRSIGIILVICFHVVFGLTTIMEADAVHRYIDTLPHLFNIMWQALGSELVFLFSGFLLSYLLLRELKSYGRIDIGNYYVRRLSRIVPLYLIALVFYALVNDFSLLDLVLNLLFVSKLFGVETIIPVGWSLEVLVQAYLLLPFIVLLFVRSGHALVLAAASIALCLGARYVALLLDAPSYTVQLYDFVFGADPPDTQAQLYYLLGYRATPFLLGFMLAYLVSCKDRLLWRVFERSWITSSVILVSLTLIIISGFLPLHDQHSVLFAITGERFWLWFWTLQRFVFALGVCGFVLCLFFGQIRLLIPVVWIMSRKVWSTISRNIYSIYLFHPVMLIPAAVIGFRAYSVEEIEPIYTLEIVAIIILATVFSVLAGKILTRYVEVPAQRWIRHRLGNFHWPKQDKE